MTYYLYDLEKHDLSSDARALSNNDKELLRYHVVSAVCHGIKQTEVAKAFGIARGTVSRWVKSYKSDGTAALRAKQKGRPKKSGTLFKPCQLELTKHLIVHNSPNLLGLSSHLWSRQVVTDFMKNYWGRSISPPTVNKYLNTWGIARIQTYHHHCQKNATRMANRTSRLDPCIREMAREEEAKIHQMSFSCVHETPCCLNPADQDTQKKQSTKKPITVVSTKTNHNRLCFLAFPGGWTEQSLISFIERLLAQESQKVFLMVDTNPVTQSKSVADWTAGRQDDLRIFYNQGNSGSQSTL